MDIRKKRAILLVCILIIFGLIFKFSSENSVKSTNTSGRVIDVIVDTHPITKKLDQNKKNIVKNALIFPIRKMAHFTIYTILGIFLMYFANTYDINMLRKVLACVLVGAFYACTDEFHQFFVPGRSSEVTDVLIDTTGAFVGTVLVIMQIKIVNRVKIFKNGLQEYKKYNKIM